MMKLVKFLKHIDFTSQVEIHNENDDIIYDGSVIPFQAIADKDTRYYEECLEDEDSRAANEYLRALRLKNVKLDTCSDYEAVSITREVNENGVEIFKLIICIKE